MPPTSSPNLLPPLSSLLDLSATLGSVRLVRRVHGRSIPLGLHHNPILSAKLIAAYSHVGLPSLSRLVFVSLLQRPSPVHWNFLLSAYSRNALFRESLSLFTHMRPLEPPDNYTLSIVTKSATELRDSKTGRKIHSLKVRLGFASDSVLSNSLMVMYSRLGSFGDARRVFDEMSERNVASWNALMSGYVAAGDGSSRREVFQVVRRMQMEGMKPDAFTISTVLPLCSSGSGSELYGREVHGFVIKHGTARGSDFHVGSCLINMYSKDKRVELARRVFDGMVSKNVVSWTAMVAAYVEAGYFVEAVDLFRAMQLIDGILPNKVTLISLLPALGSLSCLAEGKQIHAFATRAGLASEVVVNNALVDMYSKCGSLNSARHIFNDDSWQKDARSWSAMISSYGIHGRGQEAVDLFNEMLGLGIKPDHITSVGVLSACARAGLVTQGLKIYHSLVEDHGVAPTIEIYSCVVDMLGRAGQLKQALDFIHSMSLEPGPSVWGALFGASLIHNDREMQDLAHRFLLETEPENPSNYISASNSHAYSGRWDFVAEIRTRMKDRGLRKIPGYSWITIDGIVQSFFIADSSHQCSEMIYGLLENLLLAMKEASYAPDFDSLT